MKPSNSSRALAALLLASGLALSGCSFLKKDEPAPPAKPIAQPKPPDKGDPNKRFAEALGQYKANQVQEAEQAFTALTKDFPEFSGPWTNLGIIYAKSNRRPQAIAALSKAVQQNANNAVAYDWLGILWRENGDLVRARAAYDKALALNPDSALAHYNLAILLDEHLKRPAEALPHYREYQRLSGKQDLKVIAWVAEIEHASPAAARTPPPATAPASPALKPPPPAEQPRPSRMSTFEKPAPPKPSENAP